MSKTPSLTVAELLEMSPGDRDDPTWINDDFEAVLSNVKQGRGKAPDKAKLADPHNPRVSITGNFFGGRDLGRYEGQVCHFSGKGMTRTEYKGEQQVTIGDKATVQAVGPAASSGAPSGNGGSSTPPAASAPRGGNGTAAGGAVHGMTVGMALNNAVRLITHSAEPLTQEYLDSPEFSKEVHRIASDLIRVSGFLEAGRLAPSAKERADPEAAKREAEVRAAAVAEAKRKEEEERKAREEAERARNRPSAGPEGSAFPPGDDEDVPF